MIVLSPVLDAVTSRWRFPECLVVLFPDCCSTCKLEKNRKLCLILSGSRLFVRFVTGGWRFPESVVVFFPECRSTCQAGKICGCRCLILSGSRALLKFITDGWWSAEGVVMLRTACCAECQYEELGGCGSVAMKFLWPRGCSCQRLVLCHGFQVFPPASFGKPAWQCLLLCLRKNGAILWVRKFGSRPSNQPKIFVD
jgi:hypothetical protein